MLKSAKIPEFSLEIPPNFFPKLYIDEYSKVLMVFISIYIPIQEKTRIILMFNQRAREYSDREKEILYRAARMCDEENLDDIVDELLDVIMDSPDIGAIKSTALGIAIFRLINTDSLGTYVALQRVLEAGMMIEPGKTIEILRNNDESAIADEISSLFQ